MKRLTTLFAVLVACAMLAQMATAQTVFDEIENVETPEPNPGSSASAFDVATMAMQSTVFDMEDKMQSLERRVSELERTRVTAAQARKIAQEEIAKVTVALQDATGKIRTQSVSVGTNYQGHFDLNPGETLHGYYDPSTGSYIEVSGQRTYQKVHPSYSQPVQYWQASTVDFAVTQPQATQPRRGFLRARRPLRQWMSSNCPGGVCRI